uniref:Uncharacterized protein n=2 Tax=Oryza TaxID=4527 RepID=A0A0D3F3G1_9ORYZ
MGINIMIQENKCFSPSRTIVPFVTDDNRSDSPELLSETIPRRRRKRWRGNAKGHQPWPCIGS